MPRLNVLIMLLASFFLVNCGQLLDDDDFVLPSDRGEKPEEDRGPEALKVDPVQHPVAVGAWAIVDVEVRKPCNGFICWVEHRPASLEAAVSSDPEVFTVLSLDAGGLGRIEIEGHTPGFAELVIEAEGLEARIDIRVDNIHGVEFHTHSGFLAEAMDLDGVYLPGSRVAMGYDYVNEAGETLISNGIEDLELEMDVPDVAELTTVQESDTTLFEDLSDLQNGRHIAVELHQVGIATLQSQLGAHIQFEVVSDAEYATFEVIFEPVYLENGEMHTDVVPQGMSQLGTLRALQRDGRTINGYPWVDVVIESTVQPPGRCVVHHAGPWLVIEGVELGRCEIELRHEGESIQFTREIIPAEP